MTKKEKLIWAAGFFDGEGCITCYRANINKKPLKHNFGLTLAVTQKSKKSLLIFQELFGGSIKYYEKHKNSKKYYVFTLTAEESVIKCLKKLLPYLIEKREEALLALKFEPIMKKRLKYRTMPKEVYDKKESLYFQIKNIKDVKYGRCISEKKKI